MDRFILTERRGEVGIITLNRPHILNAWHSAMRRQLIEAFDVFEGDADIRAIILTGAATVRSAQVRISMKPGRSMPSAARNGLANGSVFMIACVRSPNH